LSRLSPQIASGLFVLAAGVGVVYAVTSGASDSEAPSKPLVTAVPVTQTAELTPPNLAGVDPVVQRVLFTSGKAEALSVDALVDLPPEVARVLVAYGATLTVPSNPDGQG
jgi:hypothetical protein